jgi:hypothetical protein
MQVLLLLVLVVLALVAVLVRRHQQLAAWQRELDHAFGMAADREVPRPRRL